MAKPERGSVRYAIAAGHCEGPRPAQWLSLPSQLVVYASIGALQWLGTWLWPLQDTAPFMCPVCWRVCFRGQLRPGHADDDGHSDESECPNCGCEV